MISCDGNLGRQRATKLNAADLLSLATLATGRQDVPFPVSDKFHGVKTSVTRTEPSPPNSHTSEDESEDEDVQSLLQLALEYADQISEKLQQSSHEDVHASREALTALVDYVEQTVLATRNIHAVVASFPTSDAQKSKLLRSYYQALHNAKLNINPPQSGLFGTAYNQVKEAPSTIYTVFGGQGLRSNCVEELRDIVATYPSLVEDLVHDLAALLGNLSGADAVASQLLPQGLDILAWIQDPAQVPDSTYLASAPVSVPLIGLVQLAHYEVTCKILGLTPGQFRSRIAGTTGHSQGIITAAATIAADDWPSWQEASRAAITTLFWIGIRTQQVWNTLQSYNAVSEAMVKDSIDHGERSPSPMLSVRGLTREHLQKCIAATNRRIKQGGRQLAITMANGPHHFVVSAPPKYLYGLNLQIRKAKQLLAQQRGAGDDDSNTTVVVSRFLEVSVPFHTSWLDEAASMIQNDLQETRLGSASLAIPVFGTEDGQDIGHGFGRADGENLLHKLVELVVCKNVDWGKATASLYQGTHSSVLDFGPGGVHGITSLSSPTSSARIILAGTLTGRKAGMGHKRDLFE